MSAITAKASRKMKKYAVLTREPRCFLGSFDFSWEQRKLGELALFNPKDELPQTFEYVDLESVVGTEMLSHRTEVKSSAPSRAQRLAHTGDLFYQTVRPYQKNNYLFEKPDNNYVFSTGYAQMRPYVDGYFLLSLLQSERFVKVVLDNCTGTSYPAINANDLAEIEVAAPSDESEAQRIGTIFRSIDNLITLHQRKCALLFSPFQALISMMFTTSTFSWEQRKFEEIAVRSSVICSDDTLPRVEYEDIVSGTGRLNKDIYAKQSIKSGIAFHQGDVLYGKLRPYLQNWLLPTFDGLAVGDFWVLQPQNADSSFLYRLIQSRQFDEVANQSTGTKMPRADWKLVSKTVFSIPSNISEQAAIGTYFTALDSLITLHQRKCISFTGRAGRLISTVNKKRITSSWEQRKVGDLLIERNQQAPMSDEYPLMAFIANEGVAPKGERYDRSALVTDTVNKLYKKTEKGDFIYSSNNLETGSIGLNKYGKACISPVYSIFEPTGIADSDFLGRRLVRKDFINAMVKWRQGVIYGQWRIHESDFLKIEIPVPSVEEQRKIGAYLDQLDNLITLHQRKCISFTGRAGRLISTVNKKRITSSWEQRKLSEITDKVTEKNAGLQYVETFTNSAEFGIISQRDFFDHDIAKLGSLDGYYIVKNEDFVYNPRISTSAPVGPINRNKLGRTGVMSPLYTVFRPHDIDTTYLEYFFKCGYWHSFMNFNGDSGARSDRFSIRDNVFFQMPIPIPDIDEQRKIGELLTCLDNLITLHQRKPFLMKWRNSDANRNQTNRLVL